MKQNERDYPGERLPSKIKITEQLNDEDKQTILKLINKMLTNKKFKNFF